MKRFRKSLAFGFIFCLFIACDFSAGDKLIPAAPPVSLTAKIYVEVMGDKLAANGFETSDVEKAVAKFYEDHEEFTMDDFKKIEVVNISKRKILLSEVANSFTVKFKSTKKK